MTTKEDRYTVWSAEVEQDEEDPRFVHLLISEESETRGARATALRIARTQVAHLAQRAGYSVLGNPMP